MMQLNEIPGGFGHPWMRNNYKVVWNCFGDPTAQVAEVYSPDDRREAFRLLRSVHDGREDKGFSYILLCGVVIAQYDEAGGEVRGSVPGGHI